MEWYLVREDGRKLSELSGQAPTESGHSSGNEEECGGGKGHFHPCLQNKRDSLPRDFR
jgi:hypothetical protein